MVNKGFTLVELLIVVAIIGILAAIAVPNFNDSLIRSKVARMHHDARILGTAIETYVIDYGWYPYGKNCDPTKALCSVVGTADSVLDKQIPNLASPIEYIHSFPVDLFNNKFSTASNKSLKYSVTYAALFQQVIQRNPCKGIMEAPASDMRTTFTWSVYSLGPDKKASQYYDLAYWMQMPYNSSNGIRSMGDIAWSTQPPPIWNGD